MKNSQRISLYWKCQFAGWTIASLYWTLAGVLHGGFHWGLGLLQLITDILLYVFITHGYRNFAVSNKWQDLPLNRLIVRILIAIPVMGAVYTVVTLLKLYGIKTLFLNYKPQSLALFFRLNVLDIFIAGVRLMAIWLLAYHLYHYARREIRLAGENAALELSFKQALLNNLSAQLNPHFLFNSLNTIKALIYTRPESAGRGIDLLSELLRSGLYQGKTVLITLSEEVEMVQDYLELESLRLEERLRFSFNNAVTVPDIMVPRLTLQTLVENAVKHGVSNEKEGGEVSISMSVSEGFLDIRVVNPGMLHTQEKITGIGLQNLKDRLDISYKGKAAFRLFQHDKQVCAEIKIPVV